MTDQVLQRLHAGALDELAVLAIDFLLDQPVTKLISPERTAVQVVAALRTAVQGPRTEAWLKERVADLCERVPAGPLGDRVPTALTAPLREVVARPVVPNRELVGRLLDHGAVRRLLHDVVVGALLSYARKFRAPTGSGRSLGRLKALGEGVLGGLSHEIEARLETRVNDFVNGLIDALVDQVADHFCEPANTDIYADFRAHLLDVLLSSDLHDLAAEVDKLDPDRLAEVGTAAVRAIAHRERLQDEVAGVIRAALDAEGVRGRTLRAFLEDAGMVTDDPDAEWYRELRASLVEQARAFIETRAFQGWLERLVRSSPLDDT